MLNIFHSLETLLH